jgi:LysM repeat protein
VASPRSLLTAAAAPPLDGASELIAAVNQFRSTYGMGPLNVDPILMAVAQAQNNYSISIGSITHFGPDGSRPKEQVIAAGYGGGATIFASENIVMGTGLTPAGAVQIWTGDEPHLNTMVGTYYRDVGAGAGQDDNGAFYYTLITAYVAGGYSANSTVPAGGINFPAVPAPVIRATPQADGSIVHVVASGQTLWTIAAVYDVELEELLRLNDLSEGALLHPGDRVTVQGPSSTSTPAVVFSPATATRRPSSPTAPTARRTSTPTLRPSGPIAPGNPASWALIAGGLALLAVGVAFGLKRS